MNFNLHHTICLVIIFLISINLSGQNWSVGLSAGPTIFTQNAEAEDDFIGDPLYKIRIMVQGDLKVNLNENFGLKVGVAIEQKGYDRKTPSSYGHSINENKFDYLSIPLLAEFSFGQKHKIKAHAGASFEYLLKHIWVVEIMENDRRPIDQTDEYEPFNYSALAGIGAEFLITEEVTFEIGGRCSLGLNTLQRDMSWVKFKYFGFVTFAGFRYYL